MAIEIKDISTIESQIPVGGGIFEGQRVSDDTSFQIRGYDIVKGVQGGVFYGDANGRVTQKASNLYYDDALDNLGIGTDSPTYPLHVSDGGLQWLRIDDGVNFRLALFEGLSRTILQLGEPNGGGNSRFVMSSDTLTDGFEMIGDAGKFSFFAGGTEYFNINTGLFGGVFRFNEDIVVSGAGFNIKNASNREVLTFRNDGTGEPTLSLFGDLNIPNTENRVLAYRVSSLPPTTGITDGVKTFAKDISAGQATFSIINENNYEMTFAPAEGWTNFDIITHGVDRDANFDPSTVTLQALAAKMGTLIHDFYEGNDKLSFLTN